MMDIFLANQSLFILLYFLILLYVNISYLVEHRKIHKGLQEITTEEVELKVESLSVSLLALGFSFFRSWLFYLIVYSVTKNILVAILLAIFIIMDGYHAVFNTSVEKLSKSRVMFYRAIADTIFIVAFTIYYISYVAHF